MYKYCRWDSGQDRADYVIMCKTARRENNNYHAGYEMVSIFVYHPSEGVVTAATEEQLGSC